MNEEEMFIRSLYRSGVSFYIRLIVSVGATETSGTMSVR